MYYYFLFFTSTIQSAAKTNFHGITAQGEEGHWLNMEKRYGSGALEKVQVITDKSQGELSDP